MYNKKNKLIVVLILIITVSFFIFLLSDLVLAQSTPVDPKTSLNTAANAAGLETGSSALNIADILGNIAGTVLAFTGSIFLFLVLYGGILILTSAGEEKKITKGRDIIKWAIIGMVVLALAYFLTSAILDVL